MAASAPALAPDGELSDEQIEQYLARAAARLQSKMGSKQVTPRHVDQSQEVAALKLKPGRLEEPYIATKGNVAVLDGSRLVDEKHRRAAMGIRKVEDPLAVRRAAEEKRKATAGPSWYNLPKTDLTPELKRDLQLLKMRNVLDPHRHYKKDGGGKMKAPEYSQVGTIVEGPAEFYSGRIENKQRKKTFVEEVLAGEQETSRFKRKYNELQGSKTSGKKAFYKALKAKRKGGIKKGGG